MVRSFAKIVPKIMQKKNYCPLDIAKTSFFWAQFRANCTPNCAISAAV
jgi:hypothetical protein